MSPAVSGSGGVFGVHMQNQLHVKSFLLLDYIAVFSHLTLYMFWECLGVILNNNNIKAYIGIGRECVALLTGVRLVSKQEWQHWLISVNRFVFFYFFFEIISLTLAGLGFYFKALFEKNSLWCELR